MWRVGRGPDPLTASRLRPEELDNAKTGNRFDSPLGEFGVRYFASELDGCFGETLARFRPDPHVVAAVKADHGEWVLGEVPADWRHRRQAVRVKFPDDARFLDVQHIDTRERLRGELGHILLGLGHDDLDVAAIRGGDRRLTRWISDWTYHTLEEPGDNAFAGIRYMSRLSDWTCWAVFDDIELYVVERRPIDRHEPALLRVANAFGVRVF